MKTDPRSIYAMIRSGDVERVGRALEPQRRNGMHHVSRPVNSIREKVVAARAELIFPGDDEAQEGYAAYHRGHDTHANPYHAALSEEDHRGWFKGWWHAHEEAEGRR